MALNRGRGSREDPWAELVARAGVELGSSVSRSEIEEFESASGVLLPADFTDFLQRFGFAWLGANVVLGLGPSLRACDTLPCAVAIIRREWESPFRHHAVPILHIGNGDMTYLLTSLETYEGQCAVCIWEHESNSHRLISCSFEEWLMRAVRDPNLVTPHDLP